MMKLRMDTSHTISLYTKYNKILVSTLYDGKPFNFNSKFNSKFDSIYLKVAKMVYIRQTEHFEDKFDIIKIFFKKC